jgi:hypothetical protein
MIHCPNAWKTIAQVFDLIWEVRDIRFWGMWQPADYRGQAAKYLAIARSASSYERCVRYSELASLHLAYAEMRERKIAAESTSEGRAKMSLVPR